MFHVSGSILGAQEYLTLCPSEGKDAHTHLGMVTRGNQVPLGTLSNGFAPFVPPGTRYKSLGTCSHYMLGVWFGVFFPPKPWSHSLQDTLLWSLDGFTLMLMKASDVPLPDSACGCAYKKGTGLPQLVLGTPQAGDGAWWHSFIGQHSFNQAGLHSCPLSTKTGRRFVGSPVLLPATDYNLRSGKLKLSTHLWVEAWVSRSLDWVLFSQQLVGSIYEMMLWTRRSHILCF